MDSVVFTDQARHMGLAASHGTYEP